MESKELNLKITKIRRKLPVRMLELEVIVEMVTATQNFGGGYGAELYPVTL